MSEYDICAECGSLYFGPYGHKRDCSHFPEVER